MKQYMSAFVHYYQRACNKAVVVQETGAVYRVFDGQLYAVGEVFGMLERVYFGDCRYGFWWVSQVAVRTDY